MNYDWRAAEARLNQWPQFTTTTDGAKAHFAHIRSPSRRDSAGRPGSIAEFSEVIGPLTNPRAHGDNPADSIHLVVPSILDSDYRGRHGRRARNTAGPRSPGRS